VRTQDYVRPYLRRIQRRHQFGVYFILKSMELGPSFRSAVAGFRSRIPSTASSLDKVPVTRTIYFYLRDQWGRLPIASLSFEAQALDVHVDFPLVQRLALPIPSGSSKIPGI